MFKIIKGGANAEKMEELRSPEVAYASYTANYPALNKKLYERDRKTYDLCLIQAYIKDCSFGFKVVAVSKPAIIGTRISYEAVRDHVDFAAYRKVLNKLIADFNSKYNESISYECI